MVWGPVGDMYQEPVERTQVPYICEWCGRDAWAFRRDRRFCHDSCKHYNWCSSPAGSHCHHNKDVLTRGVIENMSRARSVEERFQIWEDWRSGAAQRNADAIVKARGVMAATRAQEA